MAYTPRQRVLRAVTMALMDKEMTKLEPTTQDAIVLADLVYKYLENMGIEIVKPLYRDK